MLGLNQPLLINILGHAAGALIFAIFLVLLYSGRGWSGLQGRYLSALAASLSLAAHPTLRSLLTGLDQAYRLRKLYRFFSICSPTLPVPGLLAGLPLLCQERLLFRGADLNRKCGP